MTTDRFDLDERRRRILWRATHRGTRELDLMLGGFVREHVAAMNDTELIDLEALVELADPLLAAFLFQGLAVGAVCATPTAVRLRGWRTKLA